MERINEDVVIDDKDIGEFMFVITGILRTICI